MNAYAPAEKTLFATASRKSKSSMSSALWGPGRRDWANAAARFATCGNSHRGTCTADETTSRPLDSDAVLTSAVAGTRRHQDAQFPLLPDRFLTGRSTGSFDGDGLLLVPVTSRRCVCDRTQAGCRAAGAGGGLVGLRGRGGDGTSEGDGEGE